MSEPIDPWEVGAAGASAQRPGASSLGVTAAVLLLVSVSLQLLFAALSCAGLGIGGLGLAGVLPDRELNELGPLLFGFYGVGLVVTALPAVVQIPAAVALFRGRRPVALLWVACAASVLPMCTVYCALTSIPAGLILLVYLLVDTPADP